MTPNFSGISAYQQTNQSWKSASKRDEKVDNSKAASAASKTGTAASQSAKDSAQIQTKAWTPIDETSSLVPTVKEGYGMSIGNVELSDKAREYYDKLKGKFNNAEFILVSKDMKAQVQQNASAYGNANKMVVLIDEEKLERMSEDESYRKKYEGIIAMSQTQLANAKNSLSSSGAGIKNFGMSVDSDGNTSFFATLEKSADAQAKRIEKKAAEKKAQKTKEKKQAEKKAKEQKLEETREKNRAEKKEKADKAEDAEKTETESVDTREYVEISADTLDDLIGKVRSYAYDNSLNTVMTDAERAVGQHFDYKW